MNPNDIQYNFSYYKGSSQIIPQEAGRGCTLASHGNLPLNLALNRQDQNTFVDLFSLRVMFSPCSYSMLFHIVFENGTAVSSMILQLKLTFGNITSLTLGRFQVRKQDWRNSRFGRW